MQEQVPIERTVTGYETSWLERASWGAIFAGMFVTIVIQVMLTLLGTAIGMAAVNPMTDQNPTQGMALGSATWLLVTGLISVWVGSCVAGRLCGASRRSDGMVHGIVSWSVSTVAMLLVLATATSALLGGLSSFLGSALKSGANTPGNENAVASIQEEIKGMFPQTGGLMPPTGRNEGSQTSGNITALAQQDSELAGALAKLEANGGASRAPQDRDQVVNLLASKHNLSQDQAQNLLNQWDQQFQQARAQGGQKLRQAGQEAAHGIGQGALWGFIALLLGLLVAAWGGWAGTASLRPAVVVQR